MSLDLKSVALFQRAAMRGVISAAGAELGYSAATATQRIQGLEADLGVKLFHRTTRKVTLTQDGETFLLHAKLILGAVEDARQSLSGGTTRIKGLLRVTASATFGQKHVAPHIPEFMLEHPEAEIHLNLTDAVIDLIENGYDLAIRVGHLQTSSLLARKLADNPRIVVASPSYISKLGMPQDVEDLKKHKCLLQGAITSWTFETPTGAQKSIRVAGDFSSNYGAAILEATLGGLGISLKSIWDVERELETGKLVQLFSDHKIIPEWNIWAVRPPLPLIPARTKMFTDFLTGKFQALPRESKI